MTTIDYKEKYEKAVKAAMLAKQDTESAVTVQTLEEIFPELRESEDEKIRKRIIQALHGDVLEMSEIKDALAWLEKQGRLMKALQISNAKIAELVEEKYNLEEKLKKQDKQKPVISNDALREGITHFGITQHQIDNWLKKYVDVDNQGEQKPIDGSSAFKNKLLELFQRFRYRCIDKIPTNGEILEYVNDHIQELIDTVKNEPAEWSEEDKKMIQDIITDIAIAQEQLIDKARCEEEINWLKYLYEEGRKFL